LRIAAGRRFIILIRREQKAEPFDGLIDVAFSNIVSAAATASRFAAATFKRSKFLAGRPGGEKAASASLL